MLSHPNTTLNTSNWKVEVSLPQLKLQNEDRWDLELETQVQTLLVLEVHKVNLSQSTS